LNYLTRWRGTVQVTVDKLGVLNSSEWSHVNTDSVSSLSKLS
jgi:hypothetical protein